jgi:hypothetical protein
MSRTVNLSRMALLSAALFIGAVSTAESCPPGSYVVTVLTADANTSTNSTGGGCDLCPVGRYSSRSQTLECARCPAGYVSHIGSTVCTQCEPGTEATLISAECVLCAPGRYDDDLNGNASESTNASSACAPCPANTYQDQVGATICTTCPAGRTSVAGSSSADACCPAGNTFIGSQTLCSPCDPGTYDHDADVASPCNGCPADTYQDQLGAVGCTACPMGRTSLPGSFAPNACCLAGSVGNQSSCSYCDPGSYDHDAHAASPCEICPADTYQGQPGATSCTTCSEARPLSEPGSHSCTTQPVYVGCFADRESLTDARDLQAARRSMGSAVALGVCAEFCAGYAYMGLQWADQCFCDNTYGTYGQLEDAACGTRGDACGQNHMQAAACAMTNAVFRLPAPWTCVDQLRQSPCDPGTSTREDAEHVSALGLTADGAHAACCDVSCGAWSATEACAEGTSLVGRSETTIVGSNSQASCCTGPCAPGTWNDAGWCRPCAAGTFSATADAVECATCGAATSAAEGAIECITCATGKVDHDGSAATPCIPCAAGRFSDGGAGKACSGLCTPGSYAAEGVGVCAPCTAGRHDHDGDAATPCRLCAAGTFSRDARATACSACAPGLASVGGSSNCTVPRLSYLRERCPAEWAKCGRLAGCLVALAGVLAAPAVPFTSSDQLLGLLACARHERGACGDRRESVRARVFVCLTNR